MVDSGRKIGPKNLSVSAEAYYEPFATLIKRRQKAKIVIIYMIIKFKFIVGNDTYKNF